VSNRRHAAADILREWAIRLWNTLRPQRADSDLEQELRTHLELGAADGRIERGVASSMDALRDQRGLRWLDDLIRDVRFGLRMLWRDRTVSLVVVLVLAVGIGASTAIYSLVNACLLRKDRPVDDRWVVIRAHLANRGPALTFFSVPELVDAERATDIFESVGAITGTDFTLTEGDFPERVLGTYITANMIPMLGIPPMLGRSFGADEDTPGGPRVVVISHHFWKDKLNGDPNVLRRTIVLNHVAHAVIGVMPPYYDLWGGRLWVPLQLDRHDTDRRARRFWIAGLLREGVTEQRANARLALIADAMGREYGVKQPEYAGMALRVWNVREAVIGGVRPAYLVLLVAVALLLLTACANVASLLLARAAGRQREMSVRAAIGAGRGRLVRQMLVESCLLSVVGGMAGVVMAMAVLPLLVHLIPADYLTADPELVRVDAQAIAVSAIVSVATGIVFGLVPALRLARGNGVSSLGQRTNTGARGTRSWQHALTIVQMALTVLVAIAAALTIEAYWAAERLALGFNPKDVVSCYISLPATTYTNGGRIAAFYRTVLDEIASTSGVLGVAAITDRPLGYRAVDMTAFEIRIPGHPVPDGGAAPSAVVRLVSPTYFSVIQTPVVEGRAFVDSDTDAAPLVAVANQAFVTRLLGGGAASGTQVVLGARFGARNLAGAAARETTATIVGVAADSRQTRVIDAPVRPELFLPLAQHPGDARNMALVARTTLDDASAARAIRAGIAHADPQQPLFAFDRMDDVVMRAFGPRRLTIVLLFFFAAVSVSLAAIGLYGVVSFGVQQRQQEIGVRIAVGATMPSIVRMVIVGGLQMATIGIVAGVALGMATTRLMANQLTNVSATDPRVFTGASLLLLAIATVAAWIPARRAACVDPLVALRVEA
jgi:putative ABC transport system permease protein